MHTKDRKGERNMARDNKITVLVAETAMDTFGGEQMVYSYSNVDESQSIDVTYCKDSPEEGYVSCSTIGLYDVDCKWSYKGKRLRAEIMAVSDNVDDQIRNILSTVAFSIMDIRKCYPGMILEDIVVEYVSDSDMRHIMLTPNLMWDEIEDIELDDIHITWLMMLPISQSEYEYAREHGWKQLEEIFFEKEIDVADFYREPVI